MSGNTRRINLSRIPAAKRSAAWSRLRERHPSIAAWCLDPCVRAIKNAFDGELIIDLPETP